MSADSVFESLYQQITGNIRANSDSAQQTAERFLYSLTPGMSSLSSYSEPVNTYLQSIHERTGDTRAFRSFQNNLARLIDSGEVDEKVARLFLGVVSTDNISNATFYNDTVDIYPRSALRSIPDETRKRLNDQFMKALGEFGREFEYTQHNGQLHFNGRNGGEKPHSRIYITAKPEHTAEAMRTWKEALKEAGTENKVHFKFMDHWRFDQIVAYVTDATETDVRRTVETFERRMPPEKLAHMPSTLNLAPGISYGAEPNSMNRVLKDGGFQKLSYNALVATALQRSFTLAQKDLEAAGDTNPTPKKLKAGAQNYFGQFMKLTGVDPDTMIPNRTMRDRPEWSAWVQEQAENHRALQTDNPEQKTADTNTSSTVTTKVARGTGITGIAVDVAEGNLVAAGLGVTMEAADSSIGAQAIEKAASNFGAALKFTGKRIPVIGAFITAGFALFETGEHALKGDFNLAGAAFASGMAETAGNVVGFGLGDAAREGVRQSFIEVAGEEYAEIDKSGLRYIAEGAFRLADNAYENVTEPDEIITAQPTDSAFKPPSLA